MKDARCPYCNFEQEINHDDGYGYDESLIHNQQCGKCDKYFTYTTSILYHYEVEKADCLNGSEHKWYAVVTAPKKYTTMECSDCGERRQPTQQERIDHRLDEE